ncbi:MAG: hypothetical protein ACI8RZ_002851 [Myxococcota bacterium]|jgi:hypothetical protein
MGERRSAMMVGRAVIGGMKAAKRLIPARLLRVVEDRIFYGIFNVTRVMNDHYGWRPPDPEEDKT